VEESLDIDGLELKAPLIESVPRRQGCEKNLLLWRDATHRLGRRWWCSDRSASAAGESASNKHRELAGSHAGTISVGRRGVKHLRHP
jgi:hypothetical protein